MSIPTELEDLKKLGADVVEKLKKRRVNVADSISAIRSELRRAEQDLIDLDAAISEAEAFCKGKGGKP